MKETYLIIAKRGGKKKSRFVTIDLQAMLRDIISKVKKRSK